MYKIKSEKELTKGMDFGTVYVVNNRFVFITDAHFNKTVTHPVFFSDGTFTCDQFPYKLPTSILKKIDSTVEWC